MFSVVSLATLTAHSHSHPRQIIIIIHNIDRHSKWLSISRAGGGDQAVCSGFGASSAVSWPQLCPLWNVGQMIPLSPHQ